MFSIYHGAWAYEQKRGGLWVNTSSPLGTLYITSADATASGQTTVTSSWTEMTDNPQDIASTNGHKITVALAALGSKLPVASGNATVVIA